MIFGETAALSSKPSADHFFAVDLPQRMEVSAPCRILVVDDDNLVRKWLSNCLDTFDYEIEAAATGIEAMRVLDATPCDIVITDWFMPEMDGLELCRRLRLEKTHADIYVLMLSVRHTELDMTAGLAAGADDYIVKGAPFDEILTRLEIGRRITRQDQWRKAHDEMSTGSAGTDITR
jgi:DNA-binding response OmpR family regulator